MQNLSAKIQKDLKRIQFRKFILYENDAEPQKFISANELRFKSHIYLTSSWY